MHNLAVLVFIGLCAVASCKPAEKYTTKYDSVDLDAIVRNDRLLRNYVDCLLDKKKCTKDGAELKQNIHDALKTDCSKCSEIQKEGSKKIFRHLINNKRSWFGELEAKYDPTQIYRKQYDAELKKEGLKL